MSGQMCCWTGSGCLACPHCPDAWDRDMVGSLNYCFQSGGNLQTELWYDLNLNLEAHILAI